MATSGGESQGDVQTRWVELVVALLIVLGGIVVVRDSLRVGIQWMDDGPKAGYFPFFIGLILIASGGYIAFKTVLAWRKLASQVFVKREQLKPVFSMLLPTVVYVASIWFIGIYVASAIYIAAFMVWKGKFKWPVALGTGISVPVVLFLLFEVWFLVPLPKGPVERLIGY